MWIKLNFFIHKIVQVSIKQHKNDIIVNCITVKKDPRNPKQSKNLKFVTNFLQHVK